MEGQGGTAAAGQGDGGQVAGGEAQQDGGAPDISQVLEALNATSQSQEQMRQQMQQLGDYLQAEPWKPEAEPEPEPTPDFSFLDTGDPDLDQQLSQNFQTVMQAEIDRRTQQAIAPLQQQQAELDRRMQADQLTAEFPEMANPETARQVVKNAAEAAENVGHPELANEPWFWRATYLMGRALDAAAEEEGSEQPQVAHLEGAGGAISGGGEQVDLLKMLAGGDEGRMGRRALPFGG